MERIGQLPLAEIPHEDVRSWLLEAGFFKGMQVMPDCKEVMEELN